MLHVRCIAQQKWVMSADMGLDPASLGEPVWNINRMLNYLLISWPTFSFSPFLFLFVFCLFVCLVFFSFSSFFYFLSFFFFSRILGRSEPPLPPRLLRPWSYNIGIIPLIWWYVLKRNKQTKRNNDCSLFIDLWYRDLHAELSKKKVNQKLYLQQATIQHSKIRL